MTELPAKWKLSTLGKECTKPQYGWTASAKPDGSVKLLRTTDLTNGPLTWGTVPYCSDAPEDLTKYSVVADDIFISRAGSVGVSVHVRHVDTTVPAVFASYLIRIRAKENLLPEFLAMFLQSPDYWQQVRDLSAGATMANINAPKIQSIVIPVPPLDEQKRIVDALDDHLSRLDKALAEISRLEHKLKMLIGSLLDAEFYNNDSQNESQLADFVRFESGYSFKSTDWRTSGVPVVRIGNIQVDTFDPKGQTYVTAGVADSTKKWSVNKGDVLLTLSGATLGASAVYPLEQEARLNQRLVKISAKSTVQLEPKYLLLFLQAPGTRKLIFSESKGAAQPNISPNRVGTFAFNPPTIDIQRSFIERLEEFENHFSEARNLLLNSTKLSLALRRSVLYAAFSGRLGANL
jgi:type I restriction enzyme S subunit